MTVSSQTARDSQSGNGATTVFTVPFRILDKSHLLVTLTTAGEIVYPVLDSDYTVSNVGAASTTVTFGEAPGTGTTVLFLRQVPITQETDYVPNDPFPAESHEDALDKLTMICQQLSDLFLNGGGDVIYNSITIGDSIIYEDSDGVINLGTARYRIPVKSVSGTSEILDRLYSGCHILCTNASPVTLTLRANTGDGDLDWRTGDHFTVAQKGDGAVTVSPDTGVTIERPTGFEPACRAKYSVIGFVCEDADNGIWTVGNDMAETP